MTDVKLLDQLIEESGKTKTFLAKQCHLSSQGFYLKRMGINQFTSGEITILCRELNIDDLELKEAVFFAPEVDSESTA